MNSVTNALMISDVKPNKLQDKTKKGKIEISQTEHLMMV